jgi:hypothetical protein
MDVLAIAAAVAGFVLAAQGHAIVGAILSFGALAALATTLARTTDLGTVLPFTFESFFVVMPLCVVGWAALRTRAPGAAIVLFGFLPYYYACIALSERKIRYVPWGRGLGWDWKTAHVGTRPLAYWTLVGVCMGIAALLFALALVHDMLV